MDVRFHIDPDTHEPHVHGHGVSEAEVMDVLWHPLENRAGRDGSRVLLGRTRTGRTLRVIVAFDSDGQGVYVITAFDLRPKPLKAMRRRLKRRGKS
jgi:hypothetical protein